MVYQRERFSYPVERRDPFLPLDDSGKVGTALGAARVLGLIHHARADLSVVLLGDVRSDEIDDGDPTQREHQPGTVRLRLGESIGSTRLAEIHPYHVVLVIETPTGIRRRVVHVPRPNTWSPS